MWFPLIAGLRAIAQSDCRTVCNCAAHLVSCSLRSDEERKRKSKTYIARFNGRRPWRSCNKDCESIYGNRPKATAPRTPNAKKQNWGDQPLFDQSDLYVIPEASIDEIFDEIYSSTPSSSD